MSEHAKIQPVNGHLLIDPIPRASFMASSREIFEEVGTILATPWEPNGGNTVASGGSGGYSYARDDRPKVGDKVYFDSWLAAKFPKNESEFFWLVKWEDVRAVEHVGK